MKARTRELRQCLCDALDDRWTTVRELKVRCNMEAQTAHKHLTFLAISGEIEFSRRRGAAGQMGDHWRRKQHADRD